MNDYLTALAAGFILDLCLGDPHGLPHPVRLIGRLIEKSERIVRRIFPKSRRGELIGGAVMAAFVLLLTGGGCRLLLWGARRLDVRLGWLVAAVMSYYLLAVKSLRVESMRVYDCLKAGNVEKAREAVSMIVGRDTKPLDDLGITKAAVETVAENTSDGVIAPLFYMILGGPLLGFLYKAVNTMDSMVGYKNETYLYFGRAAARLDDLLNMIPARLAAFFMLVAGGILKMDWRQGVRIYKRDRYCHKSPNSAHTESVCAGLLRVRLAGPAWYFGVLCEKPSIGDDLRPVEYEDIRRANRLLYVTAFLAFLSMAAFRWAV